MTTTTVLRPLTARRVADDDRTWTPLMCTTCQRGYLRPAEDLTGAFWTCHRCAAVLRPNTLPGVSPADMLADRDDVLQIGIHPDAAFAVQLAAQDPETFTPAGLRTYLRHAFYPFRDTDTVMHAAALCTPATHVSTSGITFVITRTA